MNGTSNGINAYDKFTFVALSWAILHQMSTPMQMSNATRTIPRTRDDAFRSFRKSTDPRSWINMRGFIK